MLFWLIVALIIWVLYFWYGPDDPADREIEVHRMVLAAICTALSFGAVWLWHYIFP